MKISEIQEEIAKIEAADATWQNVQRLAWLYTVQDHISADKVPVVASKIQSVMPNYDGEFGEAVSGAKLDNIMTVLNEHMAVIKVLLPKEYQAVINRIKEAPE